MNIVSSISKVLSRNYPECKIYKNKVEQGMCMPCFFVSHLEGTQEKQGKNIFERAYFMNIRYHTKNPIRTNLDEIGFELMGLLDLLIDEEFKAFGNNIRFEIVDDVLQFFVTYKVRLYKSKNYKENSMNDIIVNGGIK